MNKKVWSIILLCIICISFVCEVGLLVGYHASLNAFEKRGEDIAMMAILPIMYFGTIIIGGFIASVGFFCSLMGIKTAQNSALKNISIVSVCIWSVIFLLLGPLVYIFI